MAGFWTRLLRGEKAVPELPFSTYDPAQRVLPEPYEPWTGTGGGALLYTSTGTPVADPGVPLAVERLRHTGDPAAFWAAQPNVRKVVDFIARNVASIPLRAYERVSDTDRQRLRHHVLTDTLARPQPGVSPYRFWRAVLSDGLLYDRWAVLEAPNEAGGLDLVHIPSWRLHFKTDALNRITGAWYATGDQEHPRQNLPLESLIFDVGYAPTTAGLSPIVTLRQILLEGLEAVRWRDQLWKNGARTPYWIERPAGAEWSDTARERFKTGFRNDFTGNGEHAGGGPLLEDGMQLHSLDAFKPVDTDDLEGRRLSAVECAAAFHIAPELVGAREGTYSNVDAFRQMLYRDSLGPYITAWEGALNAQLVERLEPARDVYVEAHVDAKLRGSFEEQAKVKQSATGAPWLTRNEARALENRPPIAGGDELVTPLNVLVGGQASPTDAGRQNQSARRKVAAPGGTKSVATDLQRERLQQVLAGFFRRQGAEVLDELAQGRSDWWDDERWNTELSADLLAVSHTVATIIGATEAANLGYPGSYDPDRTVEFLQQVSENRARTINKTTKAQLDEEIADDEGDPAKVFTQAENDRALTTGQQLLALTAGFAAIEAARQIRDDQGVEFTKTWITGPNPRPEHAALNGETVGIDERFSNGMEWPGIGGDADDTGCNCSVSVQGVSS